MTRRPTRRMPPAAWLLAGLAAAVVLLLFPDLAAAQDGDPAAAPSAADAGDDNKVVFIIRSVGLVFGGLLLVCSVWLVAIVVLLMLDLRMQNAIPAGFVDEFTDVVNKRKFKEAYDMARADPSFLGRVLTAGMARLQYGLEDAREAAHNALESIKTDKDSRNNYTAVIASLGPMLGLVGTVFGMIGAFMVLGKPGATANVAKLAENIAHALSVTLIGIAISVPAISFNAFLRNRIARLTLDVGHIADDLLTQMYHNSKKPAAAGPTAAATTGVPAAATAPTVTQPGR
jgi:biopolymer transport protein ExbB